MNTLKMQSRGFTLVELIVVITILVILGTIAFINLGGQSASARDSKRTSDIRNLVSQVNIKQTAGVSLVNMVNSGAASQVTTVSLGGTGGAVVGSDYQAGTPNLTLLGLSADAFKDAGSKTQDYTMGATTRIGGAYQIAATLEGDSAKTALVMGIYNPRGVTLAVHSSSGTTNGTTVTLTAGKGVFDVGDWVIGTTAGQITAISGDLTTLTTTANIGSSGSIRLVAAESQGLIRALKNSAGTDISASNLGVVNGSGAVLPY